MQPTHDSVQPSPSAADHWNAVYAAKPVDGVSWYRPHLDRSLAIIDSLALDRSVPIIDIGAGASTLVEDLLDRGYETITALDVSDRALALVRDRIGPTSSQVRWIVSDIRQASLERASVGLWHDRAVLHFLSAAEDRAMYANIARTALRPGGHAIISGFAPNGPAKCSNMEVVRASAEEIAETLGPGFHLLRSETEMHRTPWGTEQAFAYAICRRDG